MEPTRWTICIGAATFADRSDGQPALILLDLKLPKVDGLEVLRQIKGDSALKMIPVVMMTSSREEQDLLHSYQLGVNAYVVKPMKFQDFVEAVRQVGAFWGVINEVPPGSVHRDVSVGSVERLSEKGPRHAQSTPSAPFGG